MANDTLTQLYELPVNALQESFNLLLGAIPKIVTALLVLILGWFIAKLSEIIVKKLLTASKVDEWIEKKKLKKTLYGVSITDAGSLIVKYYVLIIFFKEAAYRASLIFLSDMFDTLIAAIPNITIGAGIVILGLLFADFIRKKIRKAVIPFNDTIAEVTYGIIIFFAVVMALPKFGLTNTSLLEDSFKFIVLGISLGISLAIGIGFGWAIKEGPAKQFFKKSKKK